jgi:hypothetical protein
MNRREMKSSSSHEQKGWFRGGILVLLGILGISNLPLDQIFLSEFPRRSYSGGRVVIDSADLLFTRGTEGGSLRGVMPLSSLKLNQLTWRIDLESL